MSTQSYDGRSTAPVFFGFVLRAAVAAALLTGVSSMRAHAAQDREGYLTTGGGSPVTDASNECWRTAEWARGMHYRQCDAPPAKAALAAPAVAVQAPAKPVPVVARTSPFKLSLDTLFAFDSATLRPQGRALLDRLADRIDHAEYGTMEIVGHADPIGSTSYNLRLSQRRADAVRDYLAARGLDRDSLSAEGVGSAGAVKAVGECGGSSRTDLIHCLRPDRYVELKAAGTAPSATASRALLELESERPVA